MSRKRLFDDVDPTNDPYLYTESDYRLFSRAVGPQWERVRTTLQAWYSDYPDLDGDLWSRFRQDDPRQHGAAWWELYNYTLFRGLGFTVEVHPPLPGSSRHPDLLATRGNALVYIECAVAFDSADSARADSEAWLKDCINAVSSPDFGFSLRIDSAGALRAQKSDVTKQIEDWVSSLDYEAESAVSESGRTSRPSKKFAFADSVVTL